MEGFGNAMSENYFWNPSDIASHTTIIGKIPQMLQEKPVEVSISSRAQIGISGHPPVIVVRVFTKAVIPGIFLNFGPDVKVSMYRDAIENKSQILFAKIIYFQN